MDLADLTARAAKALASGGDFSKIVKFDFGDIGTLLIDGVSKAVSNEDGDADATISVDWEDFMKLAQGQLDPTMAFMQGKLKVDGDMSVAMQLQGLLKAII